MKYIFTSMAMLLAWMAYGQANYQPGFVVTTQNDTLKGFIDYREWNNNPAFFLFKPAPDSEIKKLGVRDVTYISIDSMDAYRAMIIPISKDRIDGDLSSGVDTSSVIDTVFLKTVYQGPKVKLLSYTDKIKSRYYIQHNTDAAPVELVYRQYYNKGSERTITIVRGYQKQLIAAAMQAKNYTADVENAIRFAGYTAADLIKCVAKINGDNRAKVKRYDLSRIRWVIGAGINASTAYYKGDHDLAAPDAVNKTSYLPVASVSLD
ncbi:hypothetical protein FW774_13020 [Pedobacter sp. BS3]|uniref:hypothetical protein n=1 Tax=Pedobacter sp. BS3 TaxID=2567937 RepID=UPI0011ED6385|nr:hypothetical protein [Pedobacter sp. BS3]TZF83208.1 hypothetical protein FW774_13020 [Pedobacter sp. BS3]